MSAQQAQKQTKDNQYNQKALKSGFWYVFSEILVRGVSFLATPIYTRILTTAIFGRVRIFESWNLILVPVISLSLYNSVERAKLDFKEKYDAYISSIVTLTLLLFISIIMIMLPWKKKIIEILSFSESMFWIFPFYGCAHVCTLCLQKRERQILNYRGNIWISFLSVVPSVVISLTLLLMYKNKTTDDVLLNIRILGFYIPLILLGIGGGTIVFLRGRTSVNLRYWRYGIAYSLPLIVYSVSAQVLYQSDKIMIQKICGENWAGIYSLATTIVYIIDILSNALYGAWIPWMFEKLDNKEEKEVWKIWWLLFFGMVLLSWGLVMLSPEFVWILGGNKYVDAIWLLGSMLSAGVFQFVMLLFVALEKFYKKTEYSGWAGIISASINIGLNWLCIHHFGYYAAAYTTALSYLLSIIIHYALLKRYIKRKGILFKILLLCILIWSINIVSMFFFQMSPYVRIGILTVILVLVGLIAKNKIVIFVTQFIK